MSEYLEQLEKVFDEVDDLCEDRLCLTEHCLDVEGDAWKLEPDPYYF